MNEQLESLIYYIKWLRSQGITREELVNQQDRTGYVVELLAQAPVTALYKARNWQDAGEPLPIVAIDFAANFDAAINAAFAREGAAAQVPVAGNLFGRYVLLECHTDEDRNSLLADVESFWQRLNMYMTPQNQRAYGLAVGRVQSGKTRNYIGLMFKAIDEGYNTIIILTSKSSRLAVQTHNRVEEWLCHRGLNVVNYRPLTRVREDANGVTNGVEWLGGHFVPNQVQVGVIIKNERGHLASVREWMDRVGEAARRRMRLLFIDDESDSATPNTNNVGAPEINAPEDVRRLIQRVRDSGAERIADWIDQISLDELPPNEVDAMCERLRGATTMARFMAMIRDDVEFQRLARLNRQVEGEGHQQFDLFRLVYDMFNFGYSRRRPLNWRVLRDFLNYAFGVRQERSRINRSICELVGQSAEEPPIFSYEKMIYAGYTATPFANMLNEDPRTDPLCPDCIKPLSVNSKYFGLARIFGGEGDACNMNIVREISGDEYSAWVQVLQEAPESIDLDDAETFCRTHNFAEENAPADDREVEWTSIMRAIKWAFCTAAARRVVRLAGPHNADNSAIKYRWTTMLFNLSHLSDQDEGVHPVQQQLLQRYIDYKLNEQRRDAFVDECIAVWRAETERFTGEDFAAACAGYGDYQAYPSEDEIRAALRNWFFGRGGKVQVIQMNSNAGGLPQLDYNNPTCQDGDVLWFVCGGNAISRGLTLEGLTVSYYDRIKRASSVDTITQMGRWFGYRQGYELLPRIWMTQEAVREMKQICRVEESLHEELEDLFDAHDDDHDGNLRYPSIRTGLNTASIRYFGRRLSGRDANGAEFAGAASRCVLETVREDCAQVAFDIIRRFCVDRGDVFPVQWPNPCDRHARHRLYWRNVASADVAELIAQLRDQYLAGASRFEAEGLLREIVDYPGEWNVVVGNPDREGLPEIGNDYYAGYHRRNNPLRREFGGVVHLGRKQFTGVSLLARVPDRYIEAARAAGPVGDIRQIEETYRLMIADPNCEAWLKNPILLIDFVNGDAGQLFTQVSFYWHGHAQESFFRAVVNPNRPNVIAPVVELLDARGYASFSHLYSTFQDQLGGIDDEDFRDELNAACAQPIARIGKVTDDDANQSILSRNVYYSTTWLAAQNHMDGLSIGEVIGMSLFHRICAEHWNWFMVPYGGNQLVPTGAPPRNGIGYICYELLDQAGLEKVIAYNWRRNQYHYEWMSFALHYRRIEKARAAVQVGPRAARAAQRPRNGVEALLDALFNDAGAVAPDNPPNPVLENMTLEQKRAADVGLLNLSLRAANCLANAGITTIGHLIDMSAEDILRYRNFGRRSLSEIQRQLVKVGLDLRGNQ